MKTSEELERQHHQMLHDAHDLRQRTPDAPSAAEHERLMTYASDLESRVREQRAVLTRELEDIAAMIERLARDRRGGS